MSEVRQPLEIGETWSSSWSMLTGNMKQYGGMMLAAGVIGGLSDSYARSGGNVVGNLIMFFVSIMAVFQTLRLHFGDDPDMKPRFGAAFGLNLLSGIAILVGLILLIVPGLMLFTRWAVALPAMLRENLGISEALGRSSELTAGNRWKILGLALLLWVPFMVAVVLVSILIGAFAGETALSSLPFNIFANLAGAAIAVVTSICWTQSYLRLSGQEQGERLAEIFA